MEPLCPGIFAFEIDLPYAKERSMHVHEFHEFFLCRGGKGGQIVESGTVGMEPGELYFFPAGTPHIGNGAPPPAIACKAGVFYAGASLLSAENPGDAPAAEFLESLASAAPLRSWRIPVSKRVFSKLEDIFLEMLSEMKGREAACDAVLKAHFIKFLAAVMRGDGRAASSRRDRGARARERMRAACLFAERNFMLPVDVRKMAEMSGLSRSHFHAKFRTFAGTSFVDYLNGARVKEAKRLLREGSLPVPAVARACGFASLSRFYSEFKRRCEVPPLEYARLKAGEGADAPQRLHSS